jgi:hypothetical protein
VSVCSELKTFWNVNNKDCKAKEKNESPNHHKFDIDPLTRDERIRYGIPLNKAQTLVLKKTVLDLVSKLTMF